MVKKKISGHLWSMVCSGSHRITQWTELTSRSGRTVCSEDLEMREVNGRLSGFEHELDVGFAVGKIGVVTLIVSTEKPLML